MGARSRGAAGAGGPSGSGRSAEGVGDGVAAVAAEGAAGDLHAGAGLSALVFGQLQHAPHAVHQLAVVAALDDGVDALLALDEPLEDVVEHGIGRQRVLVLLVVLQLGGRRLGDDAFRADAYRTAARRGGKACVRTGGSRGVSY